MVMVKGERIMDDYESAVKAVSGIVLQELLLQDMKWGPQIHTAIEWKSIVNEESGEIEKALNKLFVQPNAHITEE